MRVESYGFELRDCNWTKLFVSDALKPLVFC